MTKITKKLAELNPENKVCRRAVLGKISQPIWKKESRANALKILTLLRDQKITQEELAQLLYIDITYLKKLLTGNEIFPEHIMDAIDIIFYKDK